MAIYKVIQDVEAEDTLIGPLTLKQCIYAGIAAIAAYACFVSVSEGVPFLIIFFAPLIIFGMFFAFPWSKQQPTEVWALAKIRFILKPRKRIWDQSGASELVTVTAPKKIEKNLTNGLSQTEVKSRLQALADTIDTRGWAVKNVGVNVYGQSVESSDRLVSPVNMPQEVPNYDTTAVVDVLDAQTNPLAQQLDSMMNASATAHRQKIVSQLNNPAPVQSAPEPQQGSGQQPADYWFMNNPDPSNPQQGPMYAGVSVTPPVPVAANPTADEEALVKTVRERGTQLPNYSHLRTIQPISSAPAPAPAPIPVPPQPQVQLPPVTPPVKSATLGLASNNDLSVAAIAREAQRMNPNPPDEVVVSLH